MSQSPFKKTPVIDLRDSYQQILDMPLSIMYDIRQEPTADGHVSNGKMTANGDKKMDQNEVLFDFPLG